MVSEIPKIQKIPPVVTDNSHGQNLGRKKKKLKKRNNKKKERSKNNTSLFGRLTYIKG